MAGTSTSAARAVTMTIARDGTGSAYSQRRALQGTNSNLEATLVESADLWADTAVECYVLAAIDLERLRLSDPALTCALLANLLRMTSQLARGTNEELALLAG